MAAAMRPFPARMVDEHGLEKPQEYETVGSESELDPLNTAAASVKSLRQKPDADSELTGEAKCIPRDHLPPRILVEQLPFL